MLLGFVIEAVTGRPAAEHLAAVIEELGLEQTSFPTTPKLPWPFSRGFMLDPPPAGSSAPPGPGTIDVTYSNPMVPWTAGAVVSTVPDMMAWAPMLATGAGLTPQTAASRQQWTPLATSGIRLEYGLGILRVGDWVGHDGSIFGYSDMVFHLPGTGATLVVMVNEADGDRVPSTDLWVEIVRALYPDSLPTVS